MIVKDLKSYFEKATPQEVYAHQRRVGFFLYVATITRTDSAGAANKLSEFLQTPGLDHTEAVNRAIEYLYNTRLLAIEYSGLPRNLPFVCSSDDAYADDVSTSRSTEGYLFKLFGVGLVSSSAELSFGGLG